MAFDRNAEADQAYGHKPVLLDECLEALASAPTASIWTAHWAGPVTHWRSSAA